MTEVTFFDQELAHRKRPLEGSLIFETNNIVTVRTAKAMKAIAEETATRATRAAKIKRKREIEKTDAQHLEESCHLRL